MIHKDPACWQRLRKDRRSNIAGVFAAIAVLTGTVSMTMTMTLVNGSRYEARGNLLYRVLLLPMNWWVSGSSTFEPRYVRSWKPVLAIACLAAAASLAIDMQGEEDWTVSAVSVAITFISAVASLIIYNGSLVGSEGPAR